MVEMQSTLLGLDILTNYNLSLQANGHAIITNVDKEASVKNEKLLIRDIVENTLKSPKTEKLSSKQNIFITEMVKKDVDKAQELNGKNLELEKSTAALNTKKEIALNLEKLIENDLSKDLLVVMIKLLKEFITNEIPLPTYTRYPFLKENLNSLCLRWEQPFLVVLIGINIYNNQGKLEFYMKITDNPEFFPTEKKEIFDYLKKPLNVLEKKK